MGPNPTPPLRFPYDLIPLFMAAFAKVLLMDSLPDLLVVDDGRGLASILAAYIASLIALI